MTCAFSGLSITSGCPVRVFLLCQNPYDDAIACNQHDHWVPRTPSLRAKYDSYGGIENIHPDDEFIADLWIRGLDLDMVERGTGDNKFHDLPVRRGMKFSELFNAIQEGRVLVRRDSKNFWSHLRRRADDPAQPERGPRSNYQKLLDKIRVEARVKRVPDLASVEEVLAHMVTTSPTPRHVVDEPIPQLVRVRVDLDGEMWGKDAEVLAPIRTALEKHGFAVALVAGSGRYPSAAELLVFAPPSTGQHSGPQWDAAEAGDNRQLKIAVAMVRQDVWNSLAAMPHVEYVYDPPNKSHYKRVDIDEQRRAVREALEEARAYTGDFAFMQAEMIMEKRRVFGLAKDQCPGVLGLASHLQLLPINATLPNEITDGLADFLSIAGHLRHARVMWRPSYSHGPQFGEPRKHFRFLQTISACAATDVAKDDAEGVRDEFSDIANDGRE